MRATVVFERESEAIAHMIDVALDGFARHVEFVREAGAVQCGTVAETFVNEHHTFDGEAGTEPGGSGHGK